MMMKKTILTLALASLVSPAMSGGQWTTANAAGGDGGGGGSAKSNAKSNAKAGAIAGALSASGAISGSKSYSGGSYAEGAYVDSSPVSTSHAAMGAVSQGGTNVSADDKTNNYHINPVPAPAIGDCRASINTPIISWTHEVDKCREERLIDKAYRYHGDGGNLKITNLAGELLYRQMLEARERYLEVVEPGFNDVGG